VANYGSGVGRWVIGAIAALCVVAAVGCDRVPTATPSRARVGAIRFPTPTTVDPGVMTVGPVPTARAGGEFARTTSGGLRLTLDRCELRAPGDWMVSGRVVVPEGKHDVTATLDLGFAHGDLVRSTWAHRVTFSRSGPFAVAVTGPAPSDGDPRRSTDDEVSDCEAEILKASVPVATQLAYLAPSTSRAPFVYTAPTGSIQALGIGAPLGKPLDPRTISLYTVWSGARSPITNVYVPVVAGERPALVDMGSTDSPCSKITVAIGHGDDNPAAAVTVTTRLNCGAPADDDQSVAETHQAVPGAFGFMWGRPAYPDDPDVAIRSVGDIDIWVQGGAAVSPTAVARVAATLTTASNAALATGPVPQRPSTLDRAVTSYFRAHPGLTERARFPYRGGWAIVVEDGSGSGPGTAWNYRLLRAGHIHTGWWIENSLGGGGGQQRCFTGPELSTGNDGQDRFAFAMTGNPHWTIQGLVDGAWRTIPTTNGVAFEDGTVPHPTALPGRLRPVDAAGHVPACFVG
jgi:hypothetical protein